DAALQLGVEPEAWGRDRALLQALAYTTIRWYPRIERLLGLMIPRPLPRKDAQLQALIAVGVAQLWWMRIPPHAAVHASVAAAGPLGYPRGRHLINAVLRRLQRESVDLSGQLDRDPVARYAHPMWLIQQLQGDYPDDWEGLLDAANQHPPLSLRVNRQRS